MAFATKRATFAATAGPITVTWGITFSGATYFVVGGGPQGATFPKYRIHTKTTTTADITLDAASTVDIDLFAFE
jgi:hypothetical protein